MQDGTGSRTGVLLRPLEVEHGRCLLAVFVPGPFLFEVVVVGILQGQLMHVPVGGISQIRGVYEKSKSSVPLLVSKAFQAHARLVVARAIVGAKEFVAVQMVNSQHRRFVARLKRLGDDTASR